MLWRESYRPRILEGAELPTQSLGDLVIGGFDLRAQGEIGIWWRLLDSAGLTDRVQVAFVAPTWTAQDRGLAESVLPRSMHSRLLLIEDSEGKWRDLVDPDRPERSFAMVATGKRADLLVIGPPTEEVWERFEALALSRG